MQKTQIILRTAFLFILILLFGNTTSSATECQWTVEGKILVYDDLFIDGNPEIKGLNGATVIIYASTVNQGGWVKWGEDIINSNGEYSIRKKPAQSDPAGCIMERRFKVVLKLDHNKYVKVVHYPIPPPPILPAPPVVWKEKLFESEKKAGPDVTLDTYTFNDLKDKKPNEVITDYTFTKAATMFLAYLKITKQMEAWDLNPPKAILVWPDLPGGENAAPGWSDPVADCVRVTRAWFEVNKWFDSPGTTQPDWEKRARELTHELVHQWFNKRVYEPFFLSGKTCGTHDFLESKELTFYEEFAEYAAMAINETVFGMRDNSMYYIRSRYDIYRRFLNADYGENNKKYYTKEALEDLIDSNSADWKKDLYRSEAAVVNYLRMLTKEDWYYLRFGSNYKKGIREAKVYKRAMDQYNCGDFRSPVFSPREVFVYLKQWKEKSPGNTVPTPRGIKEFYDYLSTRDQQFAGLVDHFLKLGNPHFAGKVDAWAECKEKRPVKKVKRPVKVYFK